MKYRIIADVCVPYDNTSLGAEGSSGSTLESAVTTMVFDFPNSIHTGEVLRFASVGKEIKVGEVRHDLEGGYSELHYEIRGIAAESRAEAGQTLRTLIAQHQKIFKDFQANKKPVRT